MMSFCWGMALLAGASLPLTAQATTATQPDGPALAEFDKRLKAYSAMRDQLTKGAAKQRETEEPGKIAAAREALAAKIRTERAAAKPGDIFSPAIQERIRKILAPEMAGVKGQNTRGSIWDEGPGPGSFKLEVNGVYPRDVPLGSVPPNVLEALPALPEGLEYRFVYRQLSLRDVHANLIVDFMPAAIPGK